MGLKILATVGKTALRKTRTFAQGELDAESLFEFAKKHRFNKPDGSLSQNGLLLCRMDNYMPKEGFIRTPRMKNGDTRNSVHFSLNHAVKTNNGGVVG